VPGRRIDLHTHSTASDGTTPPDVLVREARDAGLDVLALTDHDTTGGWAGAQAALPDGLTPHSLRHTFASLLVRAGHDPAYVMAQLGHTDPAVTLGIYAHALRQPSDAGARLDALVAGSIGHSLGTSPDSDGRDLTASMAARTAETPCEQGFPQARPRGFEPLTSRSGGERSIH